MKHWTDQNPVVGQKVYTDGAFKKAHPKAQEPFTLTQVFRGSPLSLMVNSREEIHYPVEIKDVNGVLFVDKELLNTFTIAQD